VFLAITLDIEEEKIKIKFIQNIKLWQAWSFYVEGEGRGSST